MIRIHGSRIKQYTPAKLSRLFKHYARYRKSDIQEGAVRIVTIYAKPVKVFMFMG